MTGQPSGAKAGRRARALALAAARALPSAAALALAFAGAFVFIQRSADANTAIVRALGEAGGIVTPQAVAAIGNALAQLRTGGAGVSIAAGVVVAVTGLIRAAARLAGPPASRAGLGTYLGVSATAAAVAWLALCAVATFCAIYGALLILANVAAAVPAGGLEAAAASGTASVRGLLQRLTDEARGALAGAPPEVTSTDWHRSAVQQLDETVGRLQRGLGDDGSGSSSGGGAQDGICPHGCIPLARQSDSSSSSSEPQPRCMCVAEAVEKVHAAARGAAGALLPAVGALACIFIATTWALVRASAAAAVARERLRLRNLSGPSAAGAGAAGGGVVGHHGQRSFEGLPSMMARVTVAPQYSPRVHASGPPGMPPPPL